jgi:hypothetical protein
MTSPRPLAERPREPVPRHGVTKRAADYHALIERFVALHAGRPRQRTEAWLAGKATSIGGSEVAALMGWNPYSNFGGVVGAKAGLRTWDGASVACWWGTMFEPVIERFVEVDCGTRLAGTDISVPAGAGSGLRGRHANSPDGYAVLTIYLGDPGSWRLLSTDAATQTAAAGRPRAEIIALLEFKCPYRRRPKGSIPRHYRPQVWSGLALSPIAHFGVFVDAGFRKCALWNFGPRGGYDGTYHRERKNPLWTTPIAWGLTGVYAPRLDAPRAEAPEGRLAKLNAPGMLAPPDAEALDAGASPAYEAWLLHYENFGLPLESPEEAARAGRPFGPDPIDFGDCSKGTFETMMLHLSQGGFRAEHVGPCFADGRGAPLKDDTEIGRAIAALAAAPPRHHYLLGVLPWKLFEVDYAFLERRPGFLGEVGPLIHECLDAAAQIREAADPAKEYREYLVALGAAKRGGPRTQKERSAVSDADVQSLFDAV